MARCSGRTLRESATTLWWQAKKSNEPKNKVYPYCKKGKLIKKVAKIANKITAATFS